MWRATLATVRTTVRAARSPRYVRMSMSALSAHGSGGSPWVRRRGWPSGRIRWTSSGRRPDPGPDQAPGRRPDPELDPELDSDELTKAHKRLQAAVEILRRPDVARADRETVVGAIQNVQLPAEASIIARERQAQEILQAGVLPLLVDLIRDDRLEDFHVPTFVTLIRVSSESLIALELLRLDAADVVASYLKHPNARLQAAASLLLGNLALQPTADAALAKDSIVDPLLRVLQSPHEALQRTAATTLGAIAGHTKGRALLVQPANLSMLCNLLSPEHSDDLRGVVAHALGNVLAGHNPAAQRLVKESGALSNLVLITSHAFSVQASGAAAWALHHSAYENPDNQTAVGAAGGVDFLFQHAFAESEALQTNALLALESLTRAHPGNLDRCRAITNAVERLYALRHDGDELNLHAQRALDALLQLIHQ